VRQEQAADAAQGDAPGLGLLGRSDGDLVEARDGELLSKMNMKRLPHIEVVC
jgi:hypothetical protein